MALTRIDMRPGIVMDDSPLAAEGGWIDGDKVRFRQGLPQTIGGWSAVNTDLFSGLCRGLHAWAAFDAGPRIAIGTHTKLYASVAGGLYDITPGGLAAGLADSLGTTAGGYGSSTYGTGTFGGTSALTEIFPRTWSFATWGEHLLACPRGQTIYEWSLDTGVVPPAIVGCPTNVASIFVTAERILVACGCQPYGSVTFDPLLVRWSDQEINTSWTPTAANQAGEYPLSQGGRVVRGLPSRKTNLLWTDTALYSMTYLGDPVLVYGFELLGSSCGLIGPNAAAEKDGNAFWMTPSGQFYSYSGGAPTPLVCPVQRYVNDNLNWLQSDKIYCSMDSANSEVWWLYPDSRDGTGNECSRYVAFNYAENTWVVGSFDRTAWIDAGVLQYPIAADSTGLVYYQEYGHTANGGAITSFLESAPRDLADGDQLASVLRVVPDIEDLSGGLSITLSGRLFPNGAELSYGPYTILPTTEKIDLRLTARQFSVRMDSASAPSFWRFGAPRFDIRLTGSKR
jgi:hypothetical protein